MRDFQGVSTDQEVDLLVKELLKGPDLFAFDVETGYTSAESAVRRSVETRHPDFVVVGFSVSNDPSWARYIPLRHAGESNLDPLRTWEAFRPVLENKQMIAHNASFERAALNSLARAGDAHSPIVPKHVGHDTMLLANSLGKYKEVGLKFLTAEVLGEDQKSFASLFGESVLDKNGKISAAKMKRTRLNQLPVSPEVIAYGCDDSALCFELFNEFYPQLTEAQRRSYMVEMQIMVLMSQAEEFGVAVDWTGMEQALSQYKNFKPKFEKKVREEFAEMTVDPAIKELARSANFASPVQMRRLLYDGLNMKTTRTTKTGAQSTDAQALEALSRKHPAVRSLLSLREIDNLGRRLKKWLDEYSGYYDGRVHPSFSQTVAITGRFAASNPPIQQCVDGKTEVLTPSGWVAFENLSSGVPVAQYHPESRGIDFVVPQIIKKHYKGEMVSLNMWRRNFLFTPDHRILSKARGAKGSNEVRAQSGAWKVNSAFEWISMGASNGCKDRSFPRAGFKIGGRCLTQEERRSLVLAVCVQADGRRHTSGNYDWYEVAVSKFRKVHALMEMGLEGKEYEVDYTRNGTYSLFKIKPEKVSEWLNDDKTFKEDVLLELSVQDMRFFIKSVHQWDGDSTRESGYKQSNKRLRDINTVQAVATLCGFSTGLNSLTDGNGATQVTFCDRDLRKSKYFTSETVDWDDFVYCVQVPSSYFVIRREGMPQITGNCPKTWHWSVVDGPENETLNGETHWSGNFRNFIVAESGNKLLTFDYSQQELRVLAGVTKEPTFVRAFKNGTDPHIATASMMLGIPVEYVTKEDRQKGKLLNFAILYGLGAQGLSEQLAVTKDEAQDLIDLYKSRLTLVGSWDARSKIVGIRDKKIATWFGREVTLWDADSSDSYTRSHAERLAVNAQIQGGAADYTKLAMLRSWQILQKHGLWGPDKVMLTMNQHDSLTFEFNESLDVNFIRSLLQEAVVFDAQKMFPKLSVPKFPVFDVDWEMGKAWGSSVGWPLDVEAVKEKESWVIPDKPEAREEVVAWDKSQRQDDIPSVTSVSFGERVLHAVATNPNAAGILKFKELVASRSGETRIHLTVGPKTVRLGSKTSLSLADSNLISMVLGGAKVYERSEEDMETIMDGSE